MLKKVLQYVGLATLLTLIVVGIVALFLTNVPEILADGLLAVYAHRKVESMPFYPVADYDNEEMRFYWATFYSNSEWLAERTMDIVPYLVLEHVTPQGSYPEVVMIRPYVGEGSFKIGGSAKCFRRSDEPLVVMLNVRGFDRGETEESHVLSTLVHELIHIQGGSFCSGDPVSYESSTEAASWEVLAGMANNGDPVAEKAFWENMESLARISVREYLMREDADWLYQIWANVMFREPKDRQQVEKWLRYWAGNKDDLKTIITRYATTPYRKILLPYLIDGKTMDSGVVGFYKDRAGNTLIYQGSQVYWDDLSVKLGLFRHILRISRWQPPL